MNWHEALIKLRRLANLEGFRFCVDFIHAQSEDGDAAGICVNRRCSFTAYVDSKEEKGRCGACGTNTVVSGLRLAEKVGGTKCCDYWP